MLQTNNSGDEAVIEYSRHRGFHINSESIISTSYLLITTIFLFIFLFSTCYSSYSQNGCYLSGQQRPLGTLYQSQNNPEVNRVTNEVLNLLSQSLLVRPAFIWFDDTRAANEYATGVKLEGSSTANVIRCCG